jgi:hypothetical protein
MADDRGMVPRAVSLSPLFVCLSAGCLALPPLPRLPAEDATGTAAGGDTGAPWGDLGVPAPWPVTSGGSHGGAATASASSSDSTSSSSLSGGAGGSTTSSSGSSSTGAAPVAQAWRITEVVADPEGTDGGASSPEWVELLNVGVAAQSVADLRVEATGWPVVDARVLGSPAIVIEPGGWLVVQRYATASDVPAAAQAPAALGGAWTLGFSSSGGLRNADGAVGVDDGLGAFADVVLWGAPQAAPFDDPGDWAGAPASAPGPGRSLCRLDADLDGDVAEDLGDCALTPGAPPPPPIADPGTVTIVEVLSNPVGASTSEGPLEFVELLNLGPGPVDLAGYVIADDPVAGATGTDPLLVAGGDGGCLPSSCLAAGRRALITGSGYAGAIGTALWLTTDDTTIANGGLTATEPVVLRDGDDLVVSSYRLWADPAAEPNPTTVEQALVRTAPEAADEPTGWTFATPTPGEP